jgi:3-phenylpropionate/trans-cinnamate dioxygenase ferredoxin reductase component
MNTATAPVAEPIVVIGGGHAAASLCGALVEAGQGARVSVVCAEAELPYHRPPLSKAYLKNPADAANPHRAEAWYAQAGIQLHRADPAVAIDRSAHTVRLQSGAVLPYARLVLATGTRARRLPGLPEGIRNVVVLRTAADAQALRERLASTRRLTVLGGGFIGLEVAATARGLGLEVQVLEAAPRLLMRSVSAELAQHVQSRHLAAGIDLRLGVKVDGFEFDGDRLVGLQVDGVHQEVELLLLGIGAEPETALAQAAGLTVDNGIVVDAQLHTSDPAILAIGDCARFPHAGSGLPLRLESVQNANDQARSAAASLLGQPSAYQALPWFWSEQGAMRLQMAGLMPADGERHRRPGASAESFSILHYRAGQLACVESVNAPLDHMAARKLLESGANPPPERACDPAVPMKSLL